jgi:hypothetical protein
MIAALNGPLQAAAAPPDTGAPDSPDLWWWERSGKGKTLEAGAEEEGVERHAVWTGPSGPQAAERSGNSVEAPDEALVGAKLELVGGMQREDAGAATDAENVEGGWKEKLELVAICTSARNETKVANSSNWMFFVLIHVV